VKAHVEVDRTGSRFTNAEKKWIEVEWWEGDTKERDETQGGRVWEGGEGKRRGEGGWWGED